MFLGISSPVVDMFQRGEVPRDVRLLAARGLLTSVDLDRLALLAMMEGDDDPEVATLALSTIDAIPASALDEFLRRTDVPDDLRTFYTRRADVPSAPAVSPPAEGTPDVAVVDTAPAPAADAVTPAPEPPPVASLDAAGALPLDLPEGEPDQAVVAAIDEAAATLADEDEEQVHQLLTSLPVPDKIKLATLGRREQRAILIRDPNRIVSTAVLASPKLTETEVEMFARMQNVSEEVLRIIGMSRVWVKSYNIVAALVKNPRTPTAVSLPLLPRLQERDVKGLTVNRNLPESVRLAARKFMAVQQERRGG